MTRLRFWLLLLVLSAATPFLFTAEPTAGGRASTSGTNNLLILCTNGGDFSPSLAIFRGEVRVLDPQMYMECELLTIHFQTNRAGSPAATKVDAPNLTNVNARIDMIVAETNFLMMARNVSIVGDRAIYTPSNEVVVITGDLVIIETEGNYTYAPKFVYDHRTGKGYAVGPTVVDIEMSRTNKAKGLLNPGRGTNAPAPGNEGKPPAR